jgi:hypothetical protein
VAAVLGEDTTGSQVWAKRFQLGGDARAQARAG